MTSDKTLIVYYLQQYFNLKTTLFLLWVAIKNGEKGENEQGNFFFYLFFKNVSFRWRLVK